MPLMTFGVWIELAPALALYLSIHECKLSLTRLITNGMSQKEGADV